MFSITNGNGDMLVMRKDLIVGLELKKEWNEKHDTLLRLYTGGLVNNTHGILLSIHEIDTMMERSINPLLGYLNGIDSGVSESVSNEGTISCKNKTRGQLDNIEMNTKPVPEPQLSTSDATMAYDKDIPTYTIEKLFTGIIPTNSKFHITVSDIHPEKSFLYIPTKDGGKSYDVPYGDIVYMKIDNNTDNESIICYKENSEIVMGKIYLKGQNLLEILYKDYRDTLAITESLGSIAKKTRGIGNDISLDDILDPHFKIIQPYHAYGPGTLVIYKLTIPAYIKEKENYLVFNIDDCRKICEDYRTIDYVYIYQTAYETELCIYFNHPKYSSINFKGDCSLKLLDVLTEDIRDSFKHYIAEKSGIVVGEEDDMDESHPALSLCEVIDMADEMFNSNYIDEESFRYGISQITNTIKTEDIIAISPNISSDELIGLISKTGLSLTDIPPCPDTHIKVLGITDCVDVGMWNIDVLWSNGAISAYRVDRNKIENITNILIAISHTINKGENK